MDAEFWLARWQKREIGFHQDDVHPALRDHWRALEAAATTAVLVPLCGKSRDMLWLRAQGHSVIGVELSPVAVRAFFDENGLSPTRTRAGRLERWEAAGITILLGDFFDLEPAHLRDVGAVYDRAALVALPPEMRARYADAMCTLLPAGAAMLLVTLTYPGDEMRGPPFSVGDDEVRRLYDETFDVRLLASEDALAANPALRARGLASLTERTYLLRKRPHV